LNQITPKPGLTVVSFLQKDFKNKSLPCSQIYLHPTALHLW